MNWQELSALLILATASSFTPGPNTTLSTALAANFGLRRAMGFVCAVPVGWSLLLAFCSAGAGALILAVPVLRWGILLAGMAYLLWLAARLANSRQLAQADASRLNVTFGKGVLLQFLNIKAWMLALSIVAAFVAGQADPLQRFLIILPVMVFFAFTSNLAYALVGSLLRQWLAQGQRLLVFNRTMASALALTAAWLLWSAL
ncbi:LysE family translocator [Curvibacter sp. HBC61]|uniref:LysE family translocator n=1 Tax=Curvibacter cyanobacteriorum TaxID=3026422 RepID=A0ABT5N1G4_9BURK|nr:LysE family translocator [Curvibacter sp. HBC61]MDD0840153.1 LysE family translocator [Curvibacter sp. HBC61]